MRHPCFAFLTAIFAALQSLPASAQVFKCTDAGGKTIYSQSPCQQTGSTEKIVKIAPAPEPSTPDPAYNGVSRSSTTATPVDANPRQPSPAPARWTGGPTSTPQFQTDQQIIAECEANRGARCNSAQEIAQRRMLDTPMTAEQQRQLQEIRRARMDGIRERQMLRR